MLKENRELFSFTHESDAAASYLVAGLSASHRVLGYQVEMISQNPTDSILPLDVRHVDDKINIYYNITSKMSLSQFLQRRKLKRNEFIDILKSIIKAVLDSKGYFLTDTGFLLDEEFIYIDPATLAISLLYVPLALEGDFGKSCKAFVTNMIVCSTQIDESVNDNFLQRILNFLKLEPFNINDFAKLLVELRSGDYAIREKSEPSEAVALTELPQLHQAERMLSSKSQPAKAAQEQPKKSSTPKNSDTVKPKLQEKKTVTKPTYRKNVLIITVLLQLLIVIIIALISISVLSSPEGDITSIAGAIIVAGAVDFLLVRKLLDKKNMIEISVVQSAPKIKAEAKPIENAETPKQVNASKGELYSISAVQSPVLPQEESSGFGASQPTELVTPAASFETVILGHTTKVQPYLKNMKEDVTEKIIISKPSFIVGRLREQVDYVSSNNAVGKVHAEIITRNGVYYIKDLNSKNGTYINDKKINSNVEHEIKNNDKITLANSEYIFITQ